jgi:hypothetical protein
MLLWGRMALERLVSEFVFVCCIWFEEFTSSLWLDLCKSCFLSKCKLGCGCCWSLFNPCPILPNLINVNPDLSIKHKMLLSESVSLH